MARSMPTNVKLAAFSLAVLAFCRPSTAHLLWVKTISHDNKPHAFLFFGESALDEAYHLPEALADAKVWRRPFEGERKELPTSGLETDDRIGRVAPLAGDKPCVLEASQQYGVYGTALLVYSAKHVHAYSSEQLNAAGASKELPLDIVPHVEGDRLELNVLWEGKPLAEAEMSIAVGEAEPIEKTTDENGRVIFQPDGDGVVSIVASRMDEGVAGKLKDKPYDHGLHYTSLTFHWPVLRGSPDRADAVLRGSPDPADKGETVGQGSGTVKRPATTSVERPATTSVGKPATTSTSSTKPRASVPPLPEPLSSFGAVVLDGWLYVYGGHMGTEHDHSQANLSKHFRRTRLGGTGSASGSQRDTGIASGTQASGTREWEELPMQTPLQGLPLVAHGEKVYRIGGMNARNPTTDEEEDLHSTAEFAGFDPAAGKWAALAPLPAPRSSHAAVVIGDRLYVVGGWALAGTSPGEWQEDALVFDFADPQAGWQTLPKPPFKRRALAASHWDGKLVAIGGLDAEGEVSQRVDLFDPRTGDWSEAAELPGAGVSGFGVSTWNLDGQLYVSGLRGVLFRLNDDGSGWEEVTRLAQPRFFHQLLPAEGGGLLAVGGASRKGHLADIEWLDVRD